MHESLLWGDPLVRVESQALLQKVCKRGQLPLVASSCANDVRKGLGPDLGCLDDAAGLQEGKNAVPFRWQDFQDRTSGCHDRGKARC